MGLGKIPKLPHKAPRPRRRSRLRTEREHPWDREDWVYFAGLLVGALGIAVTFLIGALFGYLRP